MAADMLEKDINEFVPIVRRSLTCTCSGTWLFFFGHVIGRYVITAIKTFVCTAHCGAPTTDYAIHSVIPPLHHLSAAPR